jgi:hypothetical protein
MDCIVSLWATEAGHFVGDYWNPKTATLLYRALRRHHYYEYGPHSVGIECVVLFYPVRCMRSFSLSTTPSYGYDIHATLKSQRKITSALRLYHCYYHIGMRKRTRLLSSALHSSKLSQHMIGFVSLRNSYHVYRYRIYLPRKQ